MTPDRDGPGRPSKVARLIDEYDMAGVGAELEARWTAPEGERESLRELAAWFNRRLLASALAAADVRTLDGEASNLYRLLTGDDVGAADRTRARRRLEREGVDAETLEADFVSYQAVRTYLQSHRDASYEDEGGADPLAAVAETVGPLRNRLATITEEKLARASESGGLGLGDADVTVAVRVTCRDCGSQHDVDTLLERGGCDCE